MPDIIMQIGVVLFSVLFAQLLFVFCLFCISFLKKQKYDAMYNAPISIIIPTYNESKNIGKCLEAILSTKYPEMEIIVVDDGSTDDTIKIAKTYRFVKVVKQAHKGKVDALNLGVKNSKHEFIVSIDADTLVDMKFFEQVMKPFADKSIGAVSGAVLVQNKTGFFGSFQVLEYAYNNLVRASFSSVLDSGIWFFGCLGVYRKSILVQIGGFKTDTMSEDMDVALEVYRAGYKAINVPSAVGYTVVPLSFFELLKQRARWWGGGLQAIFKHANMLTSKSSFAIKYLFYNHLWWAAYALISLPLFVYQVYYWWPVVGTTGFGIFAYLFRWFTLSGPVYVVYMNITNQWPWSVYNIFGIMSGLISVVMLVASLIIAKEKSWVKNAVCIFFYFPYTIILNILMIGSIWRFFSKKNKHFIK